MVTQKGSELAGMLPRVNVAIPATVYVNGKQVPPIEGDSVITRFGCRSLQVSCDSRIPVPSNGVLRFSFESSNKGTLELNVQIVRCIETSNNFWFWKKEPKYEAHLTLTDNSPEDSERYMKFINQLVYGNKPSRVELVPNEEE